MKNLTRISHEEPTLPSTLRALRARHREESLCGLDNPYDGQVVDPQDSRLFWTLVVRGFGASAGGSSSMLVYLSRQDERMQKMYNRI